MKKTNKKIMLLIGNPVQTSFSYACGDIYESAAQRAGADIRRFNIDEMVFDPALHQGYEVIQELEPDLVAFQEAIAWADHLVFVYPNWWSSMPAKMKGLFDRAFLPQFAFRFEHNTFKPLLCGKTARVINIVGSTYPLLLRCTVGSYTNELTRGILRPCGVRPVRVASFGPTRNTPKEKLSSWLKRVEKMAVKDAV